MSKLISCLKKQTDRQFNSIWKLWLGVILQIDLGLVVCVCPNIRLQYLVFSFLFYLLNSIFFFRTGRIKPCWLNWSITVLCNNLILIFLYFNNFQFSNWYFSINRFILLLLLFFLIFAVRIINLFIYHLLPLCFRDSFPNYICKFSK